MSTPITWVHKRTRPKIKYKKKPTMPEAKIHKALVQYLRAKYPKLLFWHTPMSGRRSHAWINMLKGFGMVPGVADLLFLHNGSFYSLEIKVATGRMNENQLRWAEYVNENGGYAAVGCGLDRCIKIIETWFGRGAG